MLHKSFRLRKNGHFSYTYKRGVSIPGRFFVLIYAKRRGKGFSIGFSVSNKTGKATVRNRLKRRMRESARSLIKSADNGGLKYFIEGYNYIFAARTSAVTAQHQEIMNEITSLVSRVRVQK